MSYNYKDIQTKVNSVITYSQGIKNPQTDPLFEGWLKGKEKFIECLGDSLIYTHPEKISFELSEEAKIKKIDKFISRVYNCYYSLEAAKFLDLNKEGFFNNTVVKSYCLSNGQTVPTGMKISKAFKFFFSDENTINNIQTEMSMIIQENKIEGQFCISVHPLDYLSSSESNYNWRSCHTLDGEYRCGNLSYMLDKCTVVCYLKGDEDTILPDFPESVPWNNKKWRMLLFMADNWNALYAGRQYPFNCDGALNVIKPIIEGVFNLRGSWSDWHNDYLESFSYSNDPRGVDSCRLTDTYVVMDGKLMSKKELITDTGEESPLHFNDLLRSSCYVPYYSFRKSGWGIPMMKTHFSVGSDVPCVDCGGGPIICTDDMRCRDCENDHGTSQDDYYNCSCCGDHIAEDDTFWINGDALCESCWADNVCICANCGDARWNDDIYWYEDECYCYSCYCDIRE